MSIARGTSSEQMSLVDAMLESSEPSHCTSSYLHIPNDVFLRTDIHPAFVFKKTFCFDVPPAIPDVQRMSDGDVESPQCRLVACKHPRPGMLSWQYISDKLDE
jgi:hypothetical protein